MDYEKNITLKEKSHAELSVKIKKADVQESYKKLLNKYSKELQIPGFRKGKVPVSVLETKYGDAIKGDLAGDLIEDSLKEIFESLDEYERPLPYSYPELERLQERNALVTACKEGTSAAKDHIATIDYCELDDKGKTISGTERQDFVFTIGSGLNIYKIDDDIIGMKKGESKEITKTFPEDDSNKDLAGKTKKIKVTLTALKYKDLPALDDDFAQDINEKYKSLDELKADIKKKFEISVEEKIKSLQKNALTEQMVKEHTIDLPESMVRAELESRWMMMANQFRTTPEELEKMFGKGPQSKATLLEGWREDSEKTLKERVLIETLLKERNIEVSDDEIEAEYVRLSERMDIALDELKKYYSNPREKEYLSEGLKEEKLFKALYEKSTIKKGKKLTFEELLKD